MNWILCVVVFLFILLVMNFLGQSILSSSQFSREELERIFVVADSMQPYARKEKASDLLKGNVLATLFFEPSTRTRFSFESAMLRLGGSVISNYMMNETSSVKKRETLYDTGRVVSRFADVIAMRHPQVGTVPELSEGATVPVLNAGEGPADHPTQGLLDLYTINNHFGSLDGLSIGLVGDVQYSRTFHSQVQMLTHFKDLTFYLVSPSGLKLPSAYKEALVNAGHRVIETEDLESVLGELDVFSMNRIQEERFESKAEAEKYRGLFSVTPELMQGAKDNMIVIDPLPRVEDQISVRFDADPRAKYFEQITNGIAVRMALLALVLGKV